MKEPKKVVVLTTYDEQRSPRTQSKSYVDASAGVKDWMEFSKRTYWDHKEWLSAFEILGHLDFIHYSGDFVSQCAFLTTVEVY